MAVRPDIGQDDDLGIDPNALFTFRWEAQLPGEILSHNADGFDEDTNTLTWYIPFAVDTQQTIHLRAESELPTLFRRMLPYLGGGILCLGILAATVTVVAWRRHQLAKPDASLDGQ